MPETEPSYHETADKNNDNSEGAQINEFNRIFSDFQRFKGCEIIDTSGRSYKCSCDIKEDKWGSFKTIIVEMNENNNISLADFTDPILKKMGLNYFVYNKQDEEQKRRQQYTLIGDRKKVNKVRYYISMNERVTTNGEKITTFQQTREYLDIKNHPREIMGISGEQVVKMLDMCNAVVKSIKSNITKKHYAKNQESVRNDQQSAEDLLKNNGLI